MSVLNGQGPIPKHNTWTHNQLQYRETTLKRLQNEINEKTMKNEAACQMLRITESVVRATEEKDNLLRRMLLH